MTIPKDRTSTCTSRRCQFFRPAAIWLASLLFVAPIVSSQVDYQFERIYPVLQQPWYFSLSGVQSFQASDEAGFEDVQVDAVRLSTVVDCQSNAAATSGRSARSFPLLEMVKASSWSGCPTATW